MAQNGWPKSKLSASEAEMNEVMRESKPNIMAINLVRSNIICKKQSLLYRYSNFDKLLQVTAYVLLYIGCLRKKIWTSPRSIKTNAATHTDARTLTETPNHRSTKISIGIFVDAHEKTMHGGVQLMAAHIRTQFWIPSLRHELRTFVSRCDLLPGVDTPSICIATTEPTSLPLTRNYVRQCKAGSQNRCRHTRRCVVCYGVSSLLPHHIKAEFGKPP